MPRFWPICPLACLASSLLAFFGSSSGLFWTLLLASGLFGMSCFWPSGLLTCFASGLPTVFWSSYGLLAFPRLSGLLAFMTPGLCVFWPVTSLGLLACGFSRPSSLGLYLSIWLRVVALSASWFSAFWSVALSARQPYSVSFCSQKTTIFLSSRV